MIPRYSRPEMSAIWAAENRFRIWFEIEAHACDAHRFIRQTVGRQIGDELAKLLGQGHLFVLQYGRDGSASLEHRLAVQSSPTIVLRNVPMLVISTSTVSPGFIHSGGFW